MPLQLDFSPVITALIIPVVLLLSEIIANKESIRRSVVYSLIGMIIGGLFAYVILQTQINGINAHYADIDATKTAITNIQENMQATAMSLEATLLPFRIETAVAATMQAAQIPTATAP